MKMREKLNIIRLDEVDSTNLYAKIHLAEIEDRCIVCAEKQNAGRGRFNRAWVDFGEGNIFMSLVLKPSDKFRPVYANLTQYFSLVLCEILEEYGLEPKIKWPNDVLVDGKKIAGILSETVVQGQNFKGLILGAGINLNAKSDDLSLVTDKKVTALNLECGKYVEKYEFLDKLMDKFFSNYDEFLSKGFVMIRDNYIARACFLGKEISVKGFNKTVSGFAKSVNSSGELVLLNDGNEFTVTMGDIL
jgi:BirA family biotin operon repressor/biotin-[acetyl-CoA-carboxylase] ligase